MYCTDIKDGFGRSLEINFENRISNFGGLATAMHLLRKNGFVSCLKQHLESTLPGRNRQVGKVKHSPISLMMQRLVALIGGREDLNDAEFLRSDKGFMIALGQEKLASTPTLCRFEREIGQDTINKGNDFLLDMWARYCGHRKYVYIDVDNTPVELYGHQESVKFNGHYRCNCYLPLLAYIDGFPIGVFNGTQDGRVTMKEKFEGLVKKIKALRPNSIVILRADSGFNGKEIIDICERNQCFYIIGLSPNEALKKRLEQWEPEFCDVFHRPPQIGGSVLRHYGEIDDYLAASWTGPRRVIVRDYFDDERREWDVRFIQTNIPKKRTEGCGKLWRISSRELYEMVYCERGTCEKHNQEFKYQAMGARVSSTRFLTNSYRMLLGAICQLAYRLLRILYFKKNTAWNTATLVKFRQAFICAPAVITELKSKVKISLNVDLLSQEDLLRFWRVNHTEL